MLEKIISERDIDLKEYPLVAGMIDNLSLKDNEYIISFLHNFKRNAYTCSSVIHGVYHAEKVFLFSFLLSRNIEEPYRKILLDAAFYHDIGRIDNYEDSFHGMTSAKKINEYIRNDSIYGNQNNLLLLKALMYAHCCDDTSVNQAGEDSNTTYFKNVADEFNLLDEDFNLPPELEPVKKKYDELLGILKDADALDRKRFIDVSIAALNPDLLRLSQSHDLINFSEQLNGLYFELMKAHYMEINETNILPKDCYHSVGFDFFKINSVIKYGVLSQDEMKRRMISIPRNFTGGNFDRWISVVDISLVKENSTAIREFINNGISFYCAGVKMHPPLSHDNRVKALEKGLPWNKSGHEDERYVLGSIAPNKLKRIIIPAEYADKNILNLTYLYNSLDINIIKARVEYYIKQTYTPKTSEYCLKLDSYIADYEGAINKYLRMNSDERKSIDIYGYLNPHLININRQIAVMVYNYYSKFFEGDKLDNITVKDVVLFELSKNKLINYKQETFEGPIVITLDSDGIKKEHIK